MYGFCPVMPDEGIFDGQYSPEYKSWNEYGRYPGKTMWLNIPMQLIIREVCQEWQG